MGDAVTGNPVQIREALLEIETPLNIHHFDSESDLKLIYEA